MMTTQAKLQALRQRMAQHQLDAWIVPSADPHQTEYMADHWKTRAWLSGFTGSAGTLVVTPDAAGLWTDFRYFLQAEQELRDSGITLFKMHTAGVPTYPAWLKQHLPANGVIGFDGAVFAVERVRELQKALTGKPIRLSSQIDLVAAIWTERPALPHTPAALFDVAFAGETRAAKLARLRERLHDLDADAHLIATLDELAWLLNLRGQDVRYNPFLIGYVLLTPDAVRLFVAPNKLTDETRAALQQDGVTICAYADLQPELQRLPQGTRLLLDPEKITQQVWDSVAAQCAIVEASNPVLHLKAVKNETELAGIRQAHVRDGVAMVKWLYWLEHTGKYAAPTELTVVAPLENFRRQTAHFQGLSFNPITAYQANAALCHYAAQPESAQTIQPHGLLLSDSGAQYLDGTTDITRTIALSEPTPAQRRDFTLVLQGHIAVATAKFPAGTTGAQIDVLARTALWQQGLNYGHGTGHGIGHFLSVHEGPHGLRANNHVPLETGMVCSNEPGIYRAGQYGIRIENLMIVVPAGETEFAAFYAFETVTRCQIDLKLIDCALLTPDERAWLNAYHQTVCADLTPFLTDAEAAWLHEYTREI